MAHKAQIKFCLSVKQKFPEYFKNRNILDCGSLDVNGNNRYLFADCEYLGVDVDQGDNVDIVSAIHDVDYPDGSFDFIISTECFEHDKFHKKSFESIVKLLTSDGMFLFTCAATGRSKHGTQKYYKNLDEKDIREAIDIDEIFREYEFSRNKSHQDLYFWGIKK